MFDTEDISLEKNDFIPKLLKTYRSLEPKQFQTIIEQEFEKFHPQYQAQQEVILSQMHRSRRRGSSLISMQQSSGKVRDQIQLMEDRACKRLQEEIKSRDFQLKTTQVRIIYYYYFHRDSADSRRKRMSQASSGKVWSWTMPIRSPIMTGISTGVCKKSRISWLRRNVDLNRCHCPRLIHKS